jgi:GNAT superfamily N-acetyltransferase
LAKPIIDAIAPDGDFNEVTGSLAAVGLGSVPSWLRPFNVLSNGEQFRAGLAKLICEKPQVVIVDEFTSVVDRQIAKIGSAAFQKAWRRSNPGGKVVVLTPHYDVLEWLEPDWIIDTKEKRFHREPGRRLRRRPKITLEVRKVNGTFWKYFKPHYYLDLPFPVAAEYFIGTVDGELVCHVAATPLFTARAYRTTRLVVMPEWQGTGVGTAFLDFVYRHHLEGKGRCGHKFPVFFHTSHPQLCRALRNRKGWVQTNASLFGSNKSRSMASIRKAHSNGSSTITGAGYGGHFRAVQAFKFIGCEVKK